MHLCCDDCWTGEIDDAEPRAIRWATRGLAREVSPAWGKFHYTEGNGLFTACGVPVVLFEVDGSPQEKELVRVDCRRCLTRMSRVPANTQAKPCGEATSA